MRSVRGAFTRPWVGPLALVVLGFLAFTVPPYLGFDPAASRVPLRDGVSMHYPLLVVHVLTGSVALTAACLQVWPWLRQRYPAVHRRSGRCYVLLGVLPAGLTALVIAQLGSWGANQQVGTTVQAVLWLAFTFAGFRAARRRRYAEHREWMIRSVALAFAIVANRPWSVICLAIYVPEVFTGGPVDQAALNQAVGVGVWLSWSGNLLLAEWWLRRHRVPALDRLAASPASMGLATRR